MKQKRLNGYTIRHETKTEITYTCRLDPESRELCVVVSRGPRGSLQHVVPKTKHLTEAVLLVHSRSVHSDHSDSTTKNAHFIVQKGAEQCYALLDAST